ncbi:MAG: hypothetical protein ACKO3W_12115 [bacterium]
MAMSIDLKPILAFVALLAIEIYLGSVVVGHMTVNARALTTTATVTNEPQHAVTEKVGRSLWTQESGYRFAYRYDVNGRTYASSGFHPEKPGATTTIFYDSTNPAISRTRPESTNKLVLFMVIIALGLAYNAWRIEWRGLFGRG